MVCVGVQTAGPAGQQPAAAGGVPARGARAAPARHQLAAARAPQPARIHHRPPVSIRYVTKTFEFTKSTYLIFIIRERDCMAKTASGKSTTHFGESKCLTLHYNLIFLYILVGTLNINK